MSFKKSPLEVSRPLVLIVALFSLVTAHSATAKGARAVVVMTPALSRVGLNKTAALSDVLDKHQLGLLLETKPKRAALMAQAKQYLAYQKGEIFLNQVCKAPQSAARNPFCAFEAEILARKTSALPLAPVAASDDENENIHSRAISGQALAQSSPEQLTGYSLGALLRAMRTFDSPAGLATLVSSIKQTPNTCYSSNLYTALGMKAEEFFPAPEQIKTAQDMYARAADCSQDDISMHARYRLSLLNIWKGNCDHVLDLLAVVEKTPSASEFHSRARYWRYQCADKLGNEDVKNEEREALWKKNPMSFHNVAINAEDPRLSLIFTERETPRITYRSALRPELNGQIRAAEAMLVLNRLVKASEILDQLGSKLAASEPEFRLYTAALTDRTGQSIPKFKILASLLNDVPRMVRPSTLKLYFPLSYYEIIKPRAAGVDPLLVLSLMRQESAFNQMARSGVGARGLMQVMPATARTIASVSARSLYEPHTNITVGTQYLARRLDYFGGDVAFTLAAYNAGSGRVDRWIKRYPGANTVLFSDLIPFRETRDYVASILRNHFWYTRLYEKSLSRNEKNSTRKTAGM